MPTCMRLWTLGQWLIGCNSNSSSPVMPNQSLAVLHNQNDMVTRFKASSWVSEAQGAVVSRGVTTCAGMTAHTVIVAQTQIGFLTGGRRASFHDLPQEEQERATVALTRARSLCVIMGPLDMKGLLGAATVIGSLMYGAGHVFKGQANFHMHGGSFRNSPSDADFGQLLEKSNCLTSTLPSTSCDCGGTARSCFSLVQDTSAPPDCC